MAKHASINKKSNNSNNPNRAPTKGGMRSKSTIMRLNMYKNGKAKRNKDGKIIGGSLLMNNTAGGQKMPKVARVAPDRRWFGNTRTISQNDLDKFREEVSAKSKDPYSVILRRKKLPMTLLEEAEVTSKVNLLENEEYEKTFGKASTRKKPKLNSSVTDYSSLLKVAAEKNEKYSFNPEVDTSNPENIQEDKFLKKDDIFLKGQSKRIWGELYKVLDCSDVVIEVIDARNVPGTRCTYIENHLKKNASHKHLIIVINKCDLVPNWVTKKWVKLLSKEFPTIAFHASITNSFGKGALISLLRQFGKLLSDKRQISVGIIGYPNTGKSSIINTLMGKKCCKAAPIPGETKVWQYITLMKRIFLIDSPGVVYDIGDDEVETVLKGVVRAEKLENPSEFIAPILERANKDFIKRLYSIQSWESDIDFLKQLALTKGKLLRGGEPDLNNVACNVIYDWQRGKLPYFVAPPNTVDIDEDEEEAENEEINNSDSKESDDDMSPNDLEIEDAEDDFDESEDEQENEIKDSIVNIDENTWEDI